MRDDKIRAPPATSVWDRALPALCREASERVLSLIQRKRPKR